jgi:hypothetical protein
MHAVMACGPQTMLTVHTANYCREGSIAGSAWS